MGRNPDNFSLSLVSKWLMLTFFSLSQLTEYLIFISLHNILFVSKSVKMKTTFIFPKLTYMCWSHNPHLSSGWSMKGSTINLKFTMFTDVGQVCFWFWKFDLVNIARYYFFCLLSLEDYFSKLLCSCKILSILVWKAISWRRRTCLRFAFCTMVWLYWMCL